MAHDKNATSTKVPALPCACAFFGNRTTLRLYNVQFGDAAMLHLGPMRAKMLIDCGSAKGTITKAGPAFAQIRRDMAILKLPTGDDRDVNSYRAGVLTHFHDDHYIGFRRLDDALFDEFYLPNFLSRDLIEMSVAELLLGDPDTVSYRQARTLLFAVPELWRKMKPSGVFRFVKRDDDFVNPLGGYRVHWPDVALMTATAKTAVETIGTILGADGDASASAYRRLVDAAFAEYAVRVDESRGYESPVLPVAGKEPPLIGFADRIDRWRAGFRADMGRMPEADRTHLDAKIASLDRVVRDVQNDLSLVFSSHNLFGLFLGDVTQDVFDRRLAGRLSDQTYKYVKIAHHGTRGNAKPYYTDQLPPAMAFLFSNGGIASRPITDQYQSYHLRSLGMTPTYPPVAFFCTNHDACDEYGKKSAACPPGTAGCGFTALYRDFR